MAVVGDNNFMRYVYRGEEGEIIPREATHIIVEARVVLARAFREHRNIVEVICHEGVEKIEDMAFHGCPNLRRVVMPGVKEVERGAFHSCRALEDVECGMLEIIRRHSFVNCFSLRGISLSSARIVEWNAFENCDALTNVVFGNKLTSLGERTFERCTSLRRITLPLKDDLFAHDDTFMECRNLRNVDLVEGELLRGTAASLLLEEWRNDMNDKIESINQILPNTWAGQYGDDGEGRFFWDEGGKVEAIRTWIRSLLQKIIHYKAEHRRILNEATAAIQQQYALPNDILTNNVLPFLALPSHTFEGENNEEEEAVNSVNEEGATGREAEDEQETHGEERGNHLHETDFSGNDAEDVGNE